MSMTQQQIAASVGLEVDGSPLKSKVAKAAEAHFQAAERVRHLMMMGVPTTYEARKAAAVELAEAQAAELQAKRALDDAIKD